MRDQAVGFQKVNNPYGVCLPEKAEVTLSDYINESRKCPNNLFKNVESDSMLTREYAHVIRRYQLNGVVETENETPRHACCMPYQAKLRQCRSSMRLWGQFVACVTLKKRLFNENLNAALPIKQYYSTLLVLCTMVGRVHEVSFKITSALHLSLID